MYKPGKKNDAANTLKPIKGVEALYTQKDTATPLLAYYLACAACICNFRLLDDGQHFKKYNFFYLTKLGLLRG